LISRMSITLNQHTLFQKKYQSIR